MFGGGLAVLVSILTIDDVVCFPACSEHLSEIVGERVRLLVRCEVPAPRVSRFEHDVAEVASPPVICVSMVQPASTKTTYASGTTIMSCWKELSPSGMGLLKCGISVMLPACLLS